MSLTYYAPILSLSFFSFLLLALDAFEIEKRKPQILRVLLWGLAIGVTFSVLPDAKHFQIFGRQMLIWDSLSYVVSCVTLLSLVGMAFFLLPTQSIIQERSSVFLSLLLMSAAGVIILSASNDLLMMFLGIELVGIPSFILVGFFRNERSSEAAMKFFLIGAFSSAMLAFGASLFYGVIGTTSLSQLPAFSTIPSEQYPLLLLSLFFILLSFGFKVGMVPFHLWVPDVFESAPTPLAAYLSVAPKLAGLAIIFRVFALWPGQIAGSLYFAIAILAAITMTVGNIIAIHQSNVFRLLGYSSIAHMGYMLLGFLGAVNGGLTGIYVYGLAYLGMNFGIFAIAMCVQASTGSATIDSFKGLVQRSPFLSGFLLLFLLSLAGIPPTAGFIGKFWLFLPAYKSVWIWLVAIAAINSVISVAYYFKFLHAVYFEKPEQTAPMANVEIPHKIINHLYERVNTMGAVCSGFSK
jgi:NADH-quinone oxidoreductase subunit N